MAASAYKKTVGGKLKLKGSSSTKKKKSHKKRSREDNSKTDEAVEKQTYELVKQQGTGRILSSGTTLMGQPGTKFLQELSTGDALSVQHPSSLVEETRIVRMVLSDVSASISSAFSSDLVSSTPFHYIKAPPEEEANKEEKKLKKKQKKETDEKTAFGTYAGGTDAGSQYTYRVKKGGAYGGYAIMKEDAGVSRSREDLLDIREKKKGDRHCM